MNHHTANTILGQKGFQLRPGYQEEGVDWMLEKEWIWSKHTTRPKVSEVYGGILADEMGLGKTIQTISVMETNRMFNTLLIVPASLINQWVTEIKKFSSNLDVYVCNHGNYLGMLEIYSRPGVVIITSYQTFVNHTDLFSSILWFRVILDEAHYIRNLSTKASSTLLKVKAINKWCLTGTPMQNYISDLYTLLEFIGINSKGVQRIHIQDILSQRMLLRTKKGVGIDIPEKTIIIRNVKPSKFELEVQNAVASVLDFDPADFDEKFNECGEIISMDFQCELERLLRMRQVSVGIQIFMESFVKEGIPGFELVKNTRLDEIVELATELENTIIFCDFHAEMRFIENKLTKTTRKRIGVIHGGIPQQKRAEILKNQTDYDILIVQIYAGGTGLNLQSFNNVIINVPHYNPFIEEQAIGRVHRDGQKRDVTIYRFIDDSGIDQRIRSIQDFKIKMFEDYIIVDN